MNHRVLIAPAHLRDAHETYAPILEEAKVEFVFPPRPAQMTESEVAESLPGCAAVLAGSEPYTREILANAAARGLQVIARAGVGCDSIDITSAREFGILVTSTPGANHDAVGEQAMGVILALVKGFFSQDSAIKSGHWPRRPFGSLRGKTLGIVGLGRTGKALAQRAASFDVRLLACDPVQDHDFARKYGVNFVDLESILSQSDIISFHVPLNETTRYMLDRKAIQQIRSTSYVVNMARGEVVDAAELAEALEEGRIAGAAVDVFEREPPVGSPLITAPNIILTAHTAGIDEEARHAMARMAAESIRTILMGGQPPKEWIVN